MALVGFAVLFAGIAAPLVATASTAALLTFVLPVAVAQPASEIGPRLLGWLLAAVCCITTCLLLWPPPWHDDLRRRLSAQSGGGPPGRRRARGTPDPGAHADVTAQLALCGSSSGTPYPPTGAAASAVALAKLVGRVEWIAGNTACSVTSTGRPNGGPLRPSPRGGRDAPPVGVPHLRRERPPGRRPGADQGGSGLDVRARRPDRRRSAADVAALIEADPRSRSVAPTQTPRRARTGASPPRWTPGSMPAPWIATGWWPMPPSRRRAQTPGRSALGMGDASTPNLVGSGSCPTFPSARSGSATPAGGRRPGAGGGDHRGHRRPARVLGGARHPVRAAIECAGYRRHRPAGRRRHGRRVHCGGARHHRRRRPHRAALGAAPAGGPGVGHRPLHDLLRRRAGRVHLGGDHPVQHHRARRLEGRSDRIEDVAIGCGVSIVVGLLFWPGGHGRAGPRTVQRLRRQLGVPGRCRGPPDDDLAARRHRTRPAGVARAYLLLDDAFRQFFAERGAKVVPVEASPVSSPGRTASGWPRSRSRRSPCSSGAGRSELESVAVAEAVLRDSYASSHRWYEEFADLLVDRRGSLEMPTPHSEVLHHVLRSAFDDVRAAPRRPGADDSPDAVGGRTSREPAPDAGRPARLGRPLRPAQAEGHADLAGGGEGGRGEERGTGGRGGGRGGGKEGCEERRRGTRERMREQGGEEGVLRKGRRKG